MTDTPDRIWAEQTGYLKKDGIYHNAGKWNDDEESGMTAFIRLDLHEAAVAAARAEGMREAARIADLHYAAGDMGNPAYHIMVALGGGK